jgi:hypothetical protein
VERPKGGGQDHVEGLPAWVERPQRVPGPRGGQGGEATEGAIEHVAALANVAIITRMLLLPLAEELLVFPLEGSLMVSL